MNEERLMDNQNQAAAEVPNDSINTINSVADDQMEGPNQNERQADSASGTEEPVNRMLEEIEGKGYFKYLALVSLSASMSALDFIYMSLAYLVQKPVYQCLDMNSQVWNVCEEE